MKKHVIPSFLLTSGALAMMFGGVNAQSALELEFVTLTHDGMVEQDVFVEDSGDPNMVRRIPVAEVDQYMDAPLFGTTEELPFEPMKLEPTETYAKGVALNITLQDWLAATGSATYECDGDKATFKASFQNLIPMGVYTMWNFIDAEPPTDPWQTLMWPLGKRDGSQAAFTADADGNGSLEATVEPCPEMSGTQTLAGLATAWHHDGKTYGVSPGELGVVTFTQSMTLLASSP